MASVWEQDIGEHGERNRVEGHTADTRAKSSKASSDQMEGGDRALNEQKQHKQQQQQQEDKEQKKQQQKQQQEKELEKQQQQQKQRQSEAGAIRIQAAVRRGQARIESGRRRAGRIEREAEEALRVQEKVLICLGGRGIQAGARGGVRVEYYALSAVVNERTYYYSKSEY